MEIVMLDRKDYNNLSLQLAEMRQAIDSLTHKHFNPLEERWLDNQEVCHILKISKRTLQSYRDNGTLAFSQAGSKIYYKASDVEAHLEKHYKESFQDC